MRTAPNLVVAGQPAIARTLRETGRFRTVFDAASASHLRELSKSGQVTPPAAFLFAPNFTEDLPGATVAVLANGLAASGFTVVAHSSYQQRGYVFSEQVNIPQRLLALEELLALLGAIDPPQITSVEPNPAPTPPQATVPAATPAPAPPQAAAPVPPPSVMAEPQTPPPPVEPLPQIPPLHLGAEPEVPPLHLYAEPEVPLLHLGPAPDVPPLQAEYAAHVPPQDVAAVPSGGAPVPAVPPVPQPFAATPAAADGAAYPAAATGGWPARQAAPATPPVQPEAPVRRRGRVIAIASAKGGVGKTSTIVNLSVLAARILQAAGRAGSAVIVDTNFQQADVGRYLSMEAPTVLDLFRSASSLSAQTIRTQLAHIPDIGLYALLGPPDAINADPALINSTLYQRILPVLRETFDYVFVDTPVAELYHTTFTDLILPEADALLVPVEPNRVTLEAASTWLRAITLPQHARGGGVDPQKLSLILNRARMDVDCSPEDVMDMMPGWRFVGMIPDDEEWMQSVNNHRFVELRVGRELELTMRGILEAVTADPVFAAGPLEPAKSSPLARLKRLLGLESPSVQPAQPAPPAPAQPPDQNHADAPAPTTPPAHAHAEADSQGRIPPYDYGSARGGLLGVPQH